MGSARIRQRRVRLACKRAAALLARGNVSSGATAKARGARSAGSDPILFVLQRVADAASAALIEAGATRIAPVVKEN